MEVEVYLLVHFGDQRHLRDREGALNALPSFFLLLFLIFTTIDLRRQFIILEEESIDGEHRGKGVRLHHRQGPLELADSIVGRHIDGRLAYPLLLLNQMRNSTI